MSGYDPVSARIRPLLLRLQRESARGSHLPVSFATLCIGLGVPSDLRSRLLRSLISEGYVIEVGIGRVQLTDAGLAQVATPRA